MQVLFDNRSGEEMPYEDIISKVLETGLHLEGKWAAGVELSVSFVTEAEIKKLNGDFRGKDQVTDVLSFPMEDETVLGDIVICVKKAWLQAQEYGHSIEREIGFLTAHSLLHLLGYDHMNEDEEKEMFAKQEEILKRAELYR